jgi:hypothetical protein
MEDTMKPERAAIKQAQAVQAVAESNAKILEALARIEEKIDRLLVAAPAQKGAGELRKEKAA